MANEWLPIGIEQKKKVKIHQAKWAKTNIGGQN